MNEVDTTSNAPTHGEASQRKCVIGMHFEFPLPPPPLDTMPMPYRHICPPDNFVGAQLLSGWIKDRLAQDGLFEGGAVWGELNNCTGKWIVADMGPSLQIIRRTVYHFLPQADRNPFYPILELGWLDLGKLEWRLWSPAESAGDFGRHFTDEVESRGQAMMNSVVARMQEEMEAINARVREILEQAQQDESGNAS
jgi:hypothetical protein